MQFIRNHKKILITAAIVLVLFCVFYLQSEHNAELATVESLIKSDADQYNTASITEPLEPLGQIEFQDQTIPLLWTDNNDDENLIIVSDRKYYDASKETEVYFSVTNQSGQDQTAEIAFWFDNGDKSIAKVEKITAGQVTNDKFPITDHFTDSNVPARKDIKDCSVSRVFTDMIAASGTNNYRAVLAVADTKKQSEFFIEAIGKTASGETTGYGHLDPYLSAGLVGYWSFNGTDVSDAANLAYDRSGNNNHGTMTNMATTSRYDIGQVGQALKFDGVNDYVITQSISLASTNNISLSMWIKYLPTTAAIGSSYGQASERFTDYNETFFFGDIADDTTCLNQLEVCLKGDTGYSCACYTRPNNGWHLFSSIYNTSLPINEVDLYIDGILQTAVTRPYNVNNPNNFGTGPIYLMTQLADSSYTEGVVDEVRLYNRALSASEIADLYRAGAAKVKTNT